MKKRKKTRALAVVIVLLVGAAAVGAFSRTLGREAEAAVEGAEVRRGPLRISIVERGNLKAADSVTLKCEIEGQTTVLYLIEEGVHVQPGELLCELDVSSLEDRRVEKEISVQNREAEYIKAKQNYEIQESQNASDIARAERELEFARLDLTKYLEGDKPQKLQQAEEDILVANEDLTLARQDVEWSEKLAARGFLEQTQLDKDRLTATKYEVRLTQSERALELLQSYEIPRAVAELEADVEEKVRELERVKLQARARIADYDAGLRTSKARYDLELDELKEIDEQIGKAKLRAPVAGMVVYAVENHGRWGGGEPMQEGRMVRERQEIITIPSEEGYVAEVSLHESVLDKVDVHMPCIVTVDAVPDRTFPAAVKFKAVLPDQQSWFANPDLRVYRCEVQLSQGDPRIRPGMSCSVEILVDEIADAIHVPVQTVFLDGGSPICFVRGRGDVEKRPVEVGQNNGKWVEVRSGLEEGEVVLLSQPAGFTLQPAVEQPAAAGETGEPGEQRGERPAGHGARSAGDHGGGRPGAPTAQAASAKPAAAESRPASAPVAADTEHAGGHDDTASAGESGAGGWGGFGGQPTEEQRERMRQWAKENPEEAARMRERMEKMRNDPEARERFRRMREQGGAPGAGGSPAPRREATQGSR